MPKKSMLKVFDCYDNLMKPKQLKTKIILIDEKQYKDLVIYFTRYDRGKTIAMLSLHYH